jgi:predicted Zn-dependent protease
VKIVTDNPRDADFDLWTHPCFVIYIDAAFLSHLDDDELAAALAHELGHVWIFTHHPFLQTEALANQIALRVASRDSLRTLYVKLWTFEGTTGSIEELLGPESVQRALP